MKKCEECRISMYIIPVISEIFLSDMRHLSWNFDEVWQSYVLSKPNTEIRNSKNEFPVN